jgi:SAM-dependent methyltransferase
MSTVMASTEAWIERWDRQQELYVPRREERFTIMAMALDHRIEIGAMTSAPRILDLGCGPGAIGQRVLSRFPAATYVGVDIDPVLLHLAREVTAPFDDRSTIEELDLVVPGWDSAFDDASFDAVVSSTALHWLDADELLRVLAVARRVLRPGGVFLNADNLSFGDTPQIQALSTAADEQQRSDASAAGADDWREWWAAARRDPVLGPLCELRDVRFPPSSQTDDPPPPLALYLDACRAAGFAEVDTIWQRFDDRVLMAVAPR